jgi:hypothetical protein
MAALGTRYDKLKEVHLRARFKRQILRTLRISAGVGLREGFEQGAMTFTRFQGGNTKHAHGTGRRATPDGPTRLAKQFASLTANMNRRQPQLSFLYEPTEFFSRRMRNGDDNVTATKRFHYSA